jgi:hypothetical protein
MHNIALAEILVSHSQLHFATTELAEKVHATNEPLEDSDITPSGCTSIKIDGMCLILGYDTIHQDSAFDAPTSQLSFQSDNLSKEESISHMREEKNRILQIAERRLLAGLDPFPPSLTESLQKDIQSILQSSLEQSMPEHLAPNSPPNANSNNTLAPITYRSKVENYLSSTIRSLLWRTYDSLSISVSHVRISVVGVSHFDKKIRVLSKRKRVRKQVRKAPDTKPDSPNRLNRFSFHEVRKMNFDSHHRFINTDFWDPNWEPYPVTITPVRRGRANKSRRSTDSLLEECSDEDNNGSQDEMKEKDAGADEEDVGVWSREGHIEMGLVLDKLDIRPGVVLHSSQKQETDEIEQNVDKDSGPTSVKHLHFRRIGVFVRRGAFSVLTAKSEQPKPRRVPKEKKLPWHGLEHDDFVVIPTNIEAECTFYRNLIDGDSTTITSTHTTKDRTENASSQRKIRVHNEASPDRVVTSDRSYATTDTKRRAKRDKRQSKSPKSTMQTIQSNFTESYLMPKQLELKWTIGHLRSTVSSRHVYLMDSCFQSLSRLRRGRPSVTIRAAKTSDRKLIERMAEEGQPVISPLDAHMYRILPQLRSTKYSRRTLLTSYRVIMSWWRYAIMSVILELKQREKLIEKCTSGTERRGSRIDLTTAQKLQWDWQEQSKIRKEYIELYLLVNSPPSNENPTQSTRVSKFAAESRLEELEHDLPVERILLLRNISRAASLSVNAKGSAGFYNFSSNARQGEKEVNADFDGVSHEICKPKPIPETKTSAQQSDMTAATQSPSKSTKAQDKARCNSLLLCSSVTIAGFSLTLSELHQADTEHDESQSDAKGDNLSDDISALTGFSDSIDSSSLCQPSEQHTVYERFDPTHRFWQYEKSNIRQEPFALLHISDITLSAQRSHLKQKYRVLVGGVAIQKDISPSSVIFSTGHISGLNQPEKGHPVNTPCISALTICESTSVSTFFNLKPSSIDIDTDWLLKLSTFLSSNKESGLKSTLAPLYKEDSLRKVAFHTRSTSTSTVSMSLEWENVQIGIPLKITDKETSSVVMTLDTLNIRKGTEINLAESKSHETTQVEGYDLVSTLRASR